MTNMDKQRFDLLEVLARREHEWVNSSGSLDSKENGDAIRTKVEETLIQRGYVHCHECKGRILAMDELQIVLLPLNEQDGIAVVVHKEPCR